MFHDGRVTVCSHFLLHYMVSNVVFKLPKQWHQRPPLIRMKPKFVIGTSIGRMIPTNGTITPHALGVLKLTLRCATVTTTSTLSPHHVIKTAVQAYATILVTTSTLGLYDATKNISNLKVRPRLIIIVMAELRHKVMCRAMGGLGPSIRLVYIKPKDVAQSLIIPFSKLPPSLAATPLHQRQSSVCLPPVPLVPVAPRHSIPTRSFCTSFSTNQCCLGVATGRQ